LLHRRARTVRDVLIQAVRRRLFHQLYEVIYEHFTQRLADKMIGLKIAAQSNKSRALFRPQALDPFNRQLVVASGARPDVLAEMAARAVFNKHSDGKELRLEQLGVLCTELGAELSASEMSKAYTVLDVSCVGVVEMPRPARCSAHELSRQQAGSRRRLFDQTFSVPVPEQRNAIIRVRLLTPRPPPPVTPRPTATGLLRTRSSSPGGSRVCLWRRSPNPEVSAAPSLQRRARMQRCALRTQTRPPMAYIPRVPALSLPKPDGTES